MKQPQREGITMHNKETRGQTLRLLARENENLIPHFKELTVMASEADVPCRVDPELWFSTDREEEHQAAEICRHCPIQTQCLEWALEANERHGTWGGLTADERRSLIRRRRNAEAARRRGEEKRSRADTPAERMSRPPAMQCARGHDWTPENTIWTTRANKAGEDAKYRQCRTCSNEARRKRDARKRAERDEQK